MSDLRFLDFKTGLKLTRLDLFDRIINLKIRILTPDGEEVVVIRSDFVKTTDIDAVAFLRNGEMPSKEKGTYKKCIYKPDVSVSYERVHNNIELKYEIEIGNLITLSKDNKKLLSFNNKDYKITHITMAMGYYGQFLDLAEATKGNVSNLDDNDYYTLGFGEGKEDTGRFGITVLTSSLVAYSGLIGLPPNLRLKISCFAGTYFSGEFVQPVQKKVEEYKPTLEEMTNTTNFNDQNIQLGDFIKEAVENTITRSWVKKDHYGDRDYCRQLSDTEISKYFGWGYVYKTNKNKYDLIAKKLNDAVKQERQKTGKTDRQDCYIAKTNGVERIKIPFDILGSQALDKNETGLLTNKSRMSSWEASIVIDKDNAKKDGVNVVWTKSAEQCIKAINKQNNETLIKMLGDIKREIDGTARSIETKTEQLQSFFNKINNSFSKSIYFDGLCIKYIESDKVIVCGNRQELIESVSKEEKNNGSVFNKYYGNIIPAIYSLTSDALATLQCPFYCHINLFSPVRFKSRYITSAMINYYISNNNSDFMDFYLYRIKVEFATIKDMNKMTLSLVDEF